MSEVSETLNRLFTQGLTRTQFIENYKKLANESGGERSIFLDNANDETIGLVFDSFHKSDNSETLTETDIKNIMALDGDDTSMSFEDLQKVYETVLQTQSDISIEARKNFLIKTANIKIDRLKNEIKELEKKKTKNEEKIKNEAKTKNEEIKRAQKELKTKQRLLKDFQAIEKEIAKKEKKLSETEDESRKNKLNSELVNLRSQLNSKTSIENEINRLSMFIKKNKNFDATKEIEKLNKPLDQQIEKKKDEIKEVEEDLQLDLEDLAAEDLAAQEENARRIAEMRDYQSGKRYDVIKGSFDSGSVDFNRNNNSISMSSFAQKGIKYDSQKGLALAQDVASHAIGFTGHCAKHVNNALTRQGLDNTRGDAWTRASGLAQNKNFQEISANDVDLKSLPAGCILVYDKGAAGYSSQYGHIEVTLGDGTACSDGRTRNLRKSNRMRIFVPVSQA